MICFPDLIAQFHRAYSFMSPGVGNLVTRFVYRTYLFGPIWRERPSPRWDTKYLDEAVWTRTWFVRSGYSSPIAHPGTDALFQDNSCSTSAHDLLCVGSADAGKHWFATAADDWLEVTEHLRARDGSNTIRAKSMTLQELSQAPFNVYFYTQRKGDLVILPPRRLGNPHSVFPS